jgi:4-alpha-glucanotransferase
MNLPAAKEGNWEWRFTNEQVPAGTARALREVAAAYGRG